MKKLYRFSYKYCDTCEYISGLFIADEEVLNQCIGNRLFFDLSNVDIILGTVVLDWHLLEEFNVSDSTLDELQKTFGSCICGHNPLQYIAEW